MKIESSHTTTEYYVTDGGVRYKVTHRTWSPNPQWRIDYNKPADGDWNVLAAQGVHAYTRQCDPDKPTFKRVVAAVKELLKQKESEKPEPVHPHNIETAMLYGKTQTMGIVTKSKKESG